MTSFYNRDIFIRWRKKVGEEKANKITRESTFRGTKYHDLVEHYMKNEDINDLNVLPSTKFLFLQSKEHLDRINNIHALEKSMYSDYLGLAGRVDCIAEFDGELAVIDFKTATKIKPEEWIENYFVQETAYACMYFEMTGIPVKKLITIMVAENGDCVVYENETKVSILNFLPSTLESLSITKQENMASKDKKPEDKLDDVIKEKFLCKQRLSLIHI